MYQTESFGMIYFRQIEDGGELRFPIALEEARELVFATYYKEQDEWVQGTYNLQNNLKPGNILEAVGGAVTASEGLTDGGWIFSIHPKALLLRLYRLYRLKKCPSISQTGAGCKMIQDSTVDLCELFHGPAILRFEERKSFNTQLVQDYLNFDIESDIEQEIEILKELSIFCI